MSGGSRVADFGPPRVGGAADAEDDAGRRIVWHPASGPSCRVSRRSAPLPLPARTGAYREEASPVEQRPRTRQLPTAPPLARAGHHRRAAARGTGHLDRRAQAGAGRRQFLQPPRPAADQPRAADTAAPGTDPAADAAETTHPAATRDHHAGRDHRQQHPARHPPGQPGDRAAARGQRQRHPGHGQDGDRDAAQSRLRLDPRRRRRPALPRRGSALLGRDPLRRRRRPGRPHRARSSRPARPWSRTTASTTRWSSRWARCTRTRH